MDRLLIAVHSDYFADALKKVFSRDYEVRVCTDGCEALHLLSSFAPHGLILCLSLPRKDGITILEQSSHTPSAILGIIDTLDSFACRRAMQLGVGRILLMPTISAVSVAFSQLRLSAAVSSPDPGAQAEILLQSLGIGSHLEGYTALRFGLPLFAADPRQTLSKELYPAISAKMGGIDCRALEHSIRTCIRTAWQRQDPHIWGKYFPADKRGRIPCPTNLKFISQLARQLRLPSSLSEE